MSIDRQGLDCVNWTGSTDKADVNKLTPIRSSLFQFIRRKEAKVKAAN